VLASPLLLAAFAAAIVPAALALSTARWPSRSPAAAIVLWQALGLGWGLAAVGALAGFGLAGSRTGLAEGALTLADSALRGRDPRVSGLRLLALAAGLLLLLLLCWILVAAFAVVMRARRRQRMLLSLLAHGDPKVPGALVVDHPAAAAYCVPGLKSKIVISAGALNLLDQAELAAVLAHERAHLRERHDLVLLPFTALLLVFRWTGVAREANAAVGLLVEMLADDRALRHRPARELATALLRVGAAGGAHAPAGALAAGGGQVAARVSRLLRPAPRLSVPALVLIGLAAVGTLAIPVAFLALPF
jgi:Zn-dependent protease with chaperone function